MGQAAMRLIITSYEPANAAGICGSNPQLQCTSASPVSPSLGEGDRIHAPTDEKSPATTRTSA